MAALNDILATGRDKSGSALPRAELSGPVSYSAAVEHAAPSVVNIYTAKIVKEQRDPFFDSPLLKRFFGKNLFGVPRQRLDTSLGSGVIASAQGYILTNNHVIADADKIKVALRDGRSFQATVVGSDPETDLVLGVGMVGPHVSEMIAEATLALEMGATLEDLMVTIHPLSLSFMMFAASGENSTSMWL